MPHPIPFPPRTRRALFPYIALRTERVRPHDLFAEYLHAVFLFDAQQRVITWS